MDKDGFKSTDIDGFKEFCKMTNTDMVEVALGAALLGAHELARDAARLEHDIKDLYKLYKAQKGTK
jgi:uncharacterized protein with PhoU and TrkA domain